MAGHGLKGDAHAGPWHRQVSLLAQESVDKMIALRTKLVPGDFGENLTTEGLIYRRYLSVPGCESGTKPCWK